MFERFTNKARHVVVLSQEEARLLSHNYIGTEHILLGLLGEPESIAGTVLESFGFTRDGVRAEVEKRIGRGKGKLSGHIPFTPRAKKVMELSLREALSIRHNYIGTEHILLGLIRENEGVGVQILRDQADLAQVRAAVLEAVPAVDPGGESAEGAEETNAVLRWLRQRLSRRGTSAAFRPEALGAEPVTPGTPAVEAALQQAAKLAGPLPVGSHHLLLAALEDTNSAGSRPLSGMFDALRSPITKVPEVSKFRWFNVIVPSRQPGTATPPFRSCFSRERQRSTLRSRQAPSMVNYSKSRSAPAALSSLLHTHNHTHVSTSLALIFALPSIPPP